MALAFIKLWECKDTLVVDEYFRLMSDAENNSFLETRAARIIQRAWRRYLTALWQAYLGKMAVIIQKNYRGYLSRKVTTQQIMEFHHNRRMDAYNLNATAIQKIWRGYNSRKRKFDYFKRKEYIKYIILKNEEMRQRLNQYDKRQKEEREKLRVKLLRKHYNDLANKMHCLKGTKAVPGVCSRLPSFKQITQLPLISARESDLLLHNKIPTHLESNQFQHIWEKPPEHLLSEWKNKKKLKEQRKQHHQIFQNFNFEHFAEPEWKKKKFQGPFQPTKRLQRHLKLPPRTTLDSTTGYDENQTAKSQEREADILARVSDKHFQVPTYVSHTKLDYCLSKEPYTRNIYGEKLFREEDATKVVSKRHFLNVVAPEKYLDDIHKRSQLP